MACGRWSAGQGRLRAHGPDRRRVGGEPWFRGVCRSRGTRPQHLAAQVRASRPSCTARIRRHVVSQIASHFPCIGASVPYQSSSRFLFLLTHFPSFKTTEDTPFTPFLARRRSPPHNTISAMSVTRHFGRSQFVGCREHAGENERRAGDDEHAGEPGCAGRI